MTDIAKLVGELRALHEKATPGPWGVVIDDDGNPLSGRPSINASDSDCGIVHWDGFVQEYWRSARGDKEIHANAALITAMRNALPALLDALEARTSPWRPIESAPKDGAYGDIVLLAWGDRTIPGRYVNNQGYQGWQPLSLVATGFNAPKPHAWQPLPSPPSSEPAPDLSATAFAQENQE